MAKHTPGPWTVSGEGRFAKVLSPSGRTIAKTDDVHTADPSDWDAMHLRNMRLIAAAPDLLEACEQLLPVLKCQSPPVLGGWNWPMLAEMVEAAISKATKE